MRACAHVWVDVLRAFRLTNPAFNATRRHIADYGLSGSTSVFDIIS